MCINKILSQLLEIMSQLFSDVMHLVERHSAITRCCVNVFCTICLWALRQLEQQEGRNKTQEDDLHLRLSSLQEVNRSLALDKANLTADVKRMEAELQLTRQANRYKLSGASSVSVCCSRTL